MTTQHFAIDFCRGGWAERRVHIRCRKVAPKPFKPTTSRHVGTPVDLLKNIHRFAQQLRRAADIMPHAGAH